MPCVPAAKALVAQVAVRVLPLPVSAEAVHPAIALFPSLNFTLPVGAVPVTLAVRVMLVRTLAGLAELTSVVALALGGPLMTSDSVALAEGTLAPSPA